MKKISVRRMLCLLTATALLVSGCGGQDSLGEDTQGAGKSSAGEKKVQEQGQEASMGRYIEEETDLSQVLEQVSGMRMREDGKLVLTDRYRNCQISQDLGVSWEEEGNSWLENKGGSAFFLDVQMAADGTLAVIYEDYEGQNPGIEVEAGAESQAAEPGDSSEKNSGAENSGAENSEAENPGSEQAGEPEDEKEPSGEEPSPEGEGDEASDSAQDSQEDSGEAESAFRLDPDCMLVRPDGTEIPVTVSIPEEEEYPSRFWISDSGRYFFTTLGEGVYEVKEDGSSELFLTAQGRPQLIQFVGDLMILDGYDFASPVFYDMEKKEYVEDPALEDFVKENYSDRQFNGGSWYDLYLFPGEEGEIYLAGKKGLHRHVIGETQVEQLVDGALSRLGSPKYGIRSMLALETGEFLAAFASGKLVRFTWDPDVASVPDRRLKIYSLEESYDLQVAASAYQVQNPEVFVEYEVGVEEGGAATRDDALKKLNTQIVAGEGPDLLMLDGLPMDSYVEKGLLLDLNDFLEEFGEQELYTNLIRAVGRDSAVYGIPTQIAFPVLLGKEEYVSAMEGLSAIAEGVERIRQDNPGKDLLGVCSEKGIMKIFAAASAPAWKKEGGELDREALSDFLTQTKRIYEAQMDGIDQKSVNLFQTSSEIYAQDSGEDWVYNISFYGGMSLEYVSGQRQLLAGVTTYPYGYFDMTSVHKARGFEDARLIPLQGQSSKVFVPRTVLGVSETSSEKELALDFLKLFLGEENQVALGGFSINRRANEELFTPEEDYVGANGEYGSMAMVDEDGVETMMDIYLPDQQEMDTFYGWMENSDTPYMEDRVLEKAVFEEGEKYFRGEAGLEQALDAVEQRLEIYMAE